MYANSKFVYLTKGEITESMMVHVKSLTNLAQLIHCYNRDHAPWWSYNDGSAKNRNVPEMIALIHSELSEALEGFRKDCNDDHLPGLKMAEVELADALIRLFDLIGAMGYDIGGVLMEKFMYNMARADHKLENMQKENGKKF